VRPRPHRRMIAAAFLLDFAVSCGLVATPFFAYEVTTRARIDGRGRSDSDGLVRRGCLASADSCTAAPGIAVGIRRGHGVRAIVRSGAADQRAVDVRPYRVGPSSLALAWPAMQAWIGANPIR